MPVTSSSPRALIAWTVLIAFSLTILAPANGWATQPVIPSADEVQAPEEAVDKASAGDKDEDPLAFRRTFTRWTTIVGAPVVLAALGAKLWNWGTTHSFRAGTDGWFEPYNSSGGMDKVAHIYACYAVTRLGSSLFEFTEQDKTKAILYGIALGTFIGVGIEVGDGFSQSYGFSFTDLVIDFVGIGLGGLLEQFPELDEAIGIGIWWFPSKGFRKAVPGSLTESFTDYTGQRFFMALRLGGIPYVRDTPLRYFQLDAGYYTKGYKNYDLVSRRQVLFFGVSVDMGRLLSSMFDDPWDKRLIDDVFKYVQIPVGFYPDSLEFSRRGYHRDK